MGFYLRKSITVGPLRFNLSKTGVGVSAGVKGFRIGMGPRGNYVHMGRHGLYYRATIPSAPAPTRPVLPEHPLPSVPSNTHDPLQEIESAEASQIVDSSSVELLRELNAKRKRIRLLPFAIACTALLLVIGGNSSLPSWSVALLLTLGATGSYLAHGRDELTKTTVVFYDLDDEMEKAYDLMHKCAEELASCSKSWHINAQGRVRDRKYHAGASNLVDRKLTFIKKAEPPFVKTNIETIAMGVGRQVLYFFPDRMLIFDSDGVGAVGYSTLEVSVTSTQFIESSGAPPDSKVVGHTWRYVNKNGTPDRRFKDNQQLPICLYDEIWLRSATGLNEVIQVSRSGVAAGLTLAIQRLASKIPSEGLRLDV